MPELLFEIGCEEAPAGFLAGALPALERLAQENFTAARLSSSGLKVLGTPRRIALTVRDLARSQPDSDEELLGPPVSAGAKALEGFTKKYGLTAAEVREADTDKGRRFTARKQQKGKPTASLLPAMLQTLVSAIPSAKSMRWANFTETFVRPIHWLVALYDGEVVPVEFAGVRSGRTSYGHRFLSPAPFEIDSISSWQTELKSRFVVVDPAQRLTLIEAELARIEKETGLAVRPDAALREEVANLVEYPMALSGSFDESFLEVPEAVIVSAMRSHQRYFAMSTQAGRLANRFVTVAGMVVRDPKVVIAGNERVLRARLADARFFLEEDKKVTLRQRAERLSGIVWIRKLGTMAQKVDRIKILANELATEFGVDPKKVADAAGLAKADLLTHMVSEFPDLQGIIGTAYAKDAGEPLDLAESIAEHYKPRSAKDEPAKGTLGAILAIADRVDSLLGCFAAGLAPTGSADPYGLRRAAIGALALFFIIVEQAKLQLRVGGFEVKP